MAPVSVSPVLDPALARRLGKVVARLRAAEAERDRLILQAHDEGASLREIAEWAGMSHVGVKKLIARYRDE